MSKIEYICEKANELIAKYNTRDPFKLCQNLDINLRYTDLGTAMKAYYFYQSRIKNIIINSRSNVTVRRVLCAHELGHAVLHGEIAALRGFHELELFNSLIPAEYEANIFAAEILVDDNDLMPLLNDSDKSFFCIAKELRIPAELLDFKLRILKSKGYRIEAPYMAQSDFLKNDITHPI